MLTEIFYDGSTRHPSLDKINQDQPDNLLPILRKLCG